MRRNGQSPSRSSPMIATLGTILTLAAALTAQHPSGGPERRAGHVGRGGRPPRIATPQGYPTGDLGSGQGRRGLFQPRRRIDHLPGGAQRRPLDLPPAQARRGRLPDLPGPAQGRCAGPDGQHGQGAMHLPLLPPERPVDPVRLDPPRIPAPRPSRPRDRPTAGRTATDGNSPSRWTSSRPTSTARTWSA